MAENQHHFEKLKIEKGSHERRVSSSFASLSLNDDVGTPSPTQQYDLLHTLTNEEFKSSEEDLSRRLLNGEDIEAGSAVATAEIGSSTASEGSFSPQHGRKPSISFAREAITSDGQKKQLEEPVPRSDPLEIPPPVLYGTEDIDWQHESGQSHPHAHSNGSLDRRKEQEQSVSSDNSMRKDSAVAHNDLPSDTEASLASAITASPTTEEPLAPMNGTLLSPTSPLFGTDKKPSPFWPTRRTDSQRSRSYQRLEKAGQMGGRRRSSRSANSSISPASAFLAQWNRAPTQPQEEPDDEGQEIADSGWIIGRAIGYGSFSAVKEVSTMDSKTAKRVVRAVKIMRKRPTRVKDDQQNERVQSEFEHEVALWRFLKHRYIVPLIAVYDTPFATFCITKLNVGGTLHDLIRSRRQQYGVNDRGLSAPLAKRYAYQLAAAIRYLHEDVRIVHRDIKLENCLLDMSAPDAASRGGNILLCDFGMADYIQNDSRKDDHPTAGPSGDTHNIGPSSSSSDLDNGIGSHSTVPADLNNRDTTLTIMGSLEYAAPEVVNATETLFSTKADIWAFGVCVYAMLTGSLPFSHSMKETLALMIEKSQWDIAPLYQAPAVRGGGLAGMAAVDLVKGCLTYGNDDRWSINDVLRARWLLNCNEIYGDGTLPEEEFEEWGR
jgi:serine/threonine protein kinase